MSASPTEALRTWERLYQQGLAHARSNELEEALLAHRGALALCDQISNTGGGGDDTLPQPPNLRYVVLPSLGYVYRMLGRLTSALECLEEAEQNLPRGDPGRLKALGELAVVYRHFERLDDSKRACEEQYEAARELGLEHEMERAIGNLGMVNYQMFLLHRDTTYLDLAVSQLQERVERCRRLRSAVDVPGDPRDRAARVQSATAREAIAFARLSLCYAAQGDPARAIEAAIECQGLSILSKDPSKIAFSRFYVGRALFLDGQKEAAIAQLNPEDGYTPIAALSKEPCEEYRGYISEMIAAGADVTLRDKTGYSALDYAVYNGDEQTQKILIEALRQQITHEEVEQHRLESKLRKGHRELFQDILRPVLLQPDKKTSVNQLRRAYADTLAADEEKARQFDKFKYVRFEDFARCGRLPKGTDNLTRCFGDDADDELFVIFMSYTWAKVNPGSGGEISPDDEKNTKYHQMISAVESFLRENPDVDPATVCIWLVSNLSRSHCYVMLHTDVPNRTGLASTR